MTINVRALVASDIPEISEMVKEVWDGHDHLPHLLSKWLEAPECNPLVMTEDSTILGTGSLRLLDNGKTGWMEALRIHPDHRGRGLGFGLTESLVDLARKFDVERLRLVTSADNEAPIKIANRYGLEKKIMMRVFWKWLREKKEPSSVEAVPLSIDEYIRHAQSDETLFPKKCIYYKEWLVHDADEVSAEKFYNSFAWKYNGGHAICLAYEDKENSEPQWNCVINASKKESFLAALNHQHAMCTERDLVSLLCIHPDGYESLYDEIDWLHEPDHKIGLLLFERLL